MKKALIAISALALILTGGSIALADENISLNYPLQGGEYEVVKTVTVNVSNELGVNARVRWGTESGVYTVSETHAVIQGENVLNLGTDITGAGLKYMKVELQDDIGSKLGDTGEISFTITAPLSGGLFEVPEGGVAAILAPVGNLMSDGWLIIAIVIGLPIGFAVIRFFVGLIRTKHHHSFREQKKRMGL